MQVKNNKPKDQSDLVNRLYGERCMINPSVYNSLVPHKLMLMTYCFFFLYRFLGNGLVSVPDYDTWKPRRKIYDPAFNKRLRVQCTLVG